MFASLITASLRRNEMSFINRLPRVVLNDLEKQALAFIVQYTRKFGSMPSVERFEREREGIFAMFITDYLIESPLPDLFEQCLQEKKASYFHEQMRKLEMLSDEGQPIPPTLITKLGRTLATLDMVDHESVYSIDRDSMYSEVIPAGLRFGYEILDKAVGSLMGGEYGILVARPGVGKTMLLCFFVVKWLREGKRVLFISCEMPTEVIVARMDGIIAQFNPSILRTKSDPAALKEYKTKVQAEYSTIQAMGGDIIFPKSRQISVSNLMSLIQDHQPDAVVVDGLYLMRNDDGGILSDWQKVKAVSNEIKQTALHENVPVFATSQLKRTGKEDGFTTDDIAYSDALSQDADLIITAHNPPGIKSQLILDLMKNRNGMGIGSTTIRFDWRHMTADEIAWDESLAITPGEDFDE